MDDKQKDLDELQLSNEPDEPEKSVSDENSDDESKVSYEDNDNWQFEADAPALKNDLFDSEIEFDAKNEIPVSQDHSVLDETQIKKKRKVNKKLLQKIICAVLVVAIVAVASFGGFYYYDYLSPVEKVGGTKIERAMFNYYYTNIVKYYEQYASEVGLDVNSDYKTTYTQDEDGNKISWYDFFKKQSLTELNNTTKFYVAAKEAGIEVNDDMQKVIDDYIENAKSSATAAGKENLDEYLTSVYGGGVNEELLRQFCEQSILANAYQGYCVADANYTDEQIDAYYKEHQKDFRQMNLCYVAVEYDESNAEQSIKNVEKYMKKITDKQSMIDLIPELYATYIEQDVKSQMQNYEAMTDEEKKNYIADKGAPMTEETARKEALAAYEANIYLTISNDFNPFDDKINDWIYSDETPVGAKNYAVIAENGYAYILLKTEPATVNETKTYSVRHILVQPQADDETKQQSNEFTDEQWQAAEKRAQEIVDEYNKGDKTQRSFALLAEKETDDTASTAAALQGYYGGLYAGILETDNYAAEFKNWSLDSSRKYGDVEIVKTQFGYHIMYFVSQLPKYKADIVEDLKNEDILKSIEKYDVKQYDHAINKIIDGYYKAKEKTAAQNTTGQ